MIRLADAGTFFTFGIRAWCVWIPSPVMRRVGWRGVVGVPRNRVTVLWPAFHMRSPYFFHTISPYHSSSHCRLGRSGQGGPSFCADFPMSFSRRFLSMRRCLVAIASDMPCRGFGSSCLHVLNSSRWSHIAIRSQTLSIVSSHERVSASPVSSSLEVHSQSFMTLSRSFFII